jgi:hypothetical protein
MWKHCCHVLCRLTVTDILVFHAVDTNLYLYFVICMQYVNVHRLSVQVIDG